MFDESSSVRPARESMVLFIGVVAVWVALVALFVAYAGMLWPALLNAALMLYLVVLAWRSQTVSRLFEQGGTIYYQGGFGQPRALASAGDGSRIARVQYDAGGPTIDYWLGPDGRTRLKTSEPRWNRAELQVLWARIGLAAPAQAELVELGQADKRYPAVKPLFFFRLLGVATRPQDPDVRIVRPAPDRQAAAFRLAMVFVIGWAITSGGAAERWLSLVVLVGGSLFLLGASAVLPARIALIDDGKTLSYRNALGRVRPVVTRGEPGHVIRARVRGNQFGPLRVQLWTDSVGRCRLLLRESEWDTDALATLRERFDLPVQELDGVRPRGEVNDRFPGANLTTELQVAVAAVGIFFGVVAVLVAYGLLTA